MVQCYYKNDAQPNLIRSINSGVCMGSGSAAGVFSCCFPWDTCLPNGICHSNTNTSSTYYTALCTDQTLQDPVCQHGCSGLYRTGLQYDVSSNSWICCDSNNKYQCSTSTNSTFSAPAPQALLAQTMTIVDFIPSSTAAASSSTTNKSTSGTTTASTSTSSSSSSSSIQPSTSSSSTTISSTPQLHQSSSLSTGAKAGIGIGITILILALITGLAIWLLKRKKKNKLTNQNQISHGPAKSHQWDLAGEMPANTFGPVVEKHAPVTQVYEADSTPPRVHSAGNGGRGYELG